jgi:hypothetical protein
VTPGNLGSSTPSEHLPNANESSYPLLQVMHPGLENRSLYLCALLSNHCGQFRHDEATSASVSAWHFKTFRSRLMNFGQQEHDLRRTLPPTLHSALSCPLVDDRATPASCIRHPHIRIHNITHHQLGPGVYFTGGVFLRTQSSGIFSWTLLLFRSRRVRACMHRSLAGPFEPFILATAPSPNLNSLTSGL